MAIALVEMNTKGFVDLSVDSNLLVNPMSLKEPINVGTIKNTVL